ncbi:MAG: methionyl-tRNA formyltransferase [Spirochaetota bacterium]
MKLGFFGSSELTRACITAAIGAGFTPDFVVSQPDRKKDRHGGIVALPVSDFARTHGMEIFSPEDINAPEAAERIRSYRPDVVIVVAYGQLLTQQILDIPRTVMVNIHGSLLPKYRGASPIERSLLNGDTSTGVTLQKVVRRMDAGDIISTRSIDIDAEWGYAELFDAVSRASALLTAEFLSDVEGHCARAHAQDENEASYCYKISKSDGHIDWNEDAGAIVNKVRAYSHWPVAFTTLRGKMLRIFRASAGESLDNMPAGSIIELSAAGIKVNAGGGSVLLSDMQWEGRKRQSAKDFLNGARLSKGEILG